MRNHIGAQDWSFAASWPLVTATCILLVAAPSSVSAGSDNASHPGIAPPQSHPYGTSYEEWSALHWKWEFSLPVDHHPLFDTADCSAGQSGPVWFLGGTLATTVDPSGEVVGIADRHCRVPVGTALFFPIADTECSTIEGNGTTDFELRSCAKFFQDHVHNMTATVDGVPVEHLDSYRVKSPLFTFGPLPDNNILQFFNINAPEGSTSESVSDGVFLMLRPLSKGDHTIHFTAVQTFSTANGDSSDFEFRQDITYHLTVVARRAAP